MGEAKQRRLAQEKQVASYMETNTVWNDVNVVAAECRNLLLQYAQIPRIIEDAALMSFLKDPISFANHIRILSKDISDMGMQLKELDGMFAEQRVKGRAATMEEAMLAIELSEKYGQWVGQHHGVVSPNYQAILEDIRIAEHLMREHSRDIAAEGTPDPAQVVLEAIRADNAVVREVVGIKSPTPGDTSASAETSEPETQAESKD